MSCLSKVVPFISRRFNFASQFICTLWRRSFKSTSPQRLFVESATVKRRFFSWRRVLMTAFIVNEQPVSGWCYCTNCPLFRGSPFANSARAGLPWKTFPTVHYCLPPEWLPFAGAITNVCMPLHYAKISLLCVRRTLCARALMAMWRALHQYRPFCVPSDSE